jgi:hypothetical protein
LVLWSKGTFDGMYHAAYFLSLHRKLDIVSVSKLYKKLLRLIEISASTASEPGVMERFHVSETKATLGLSLFVIGE